MMNLNPYWVLAKYGGIFLLLVALVGAIFYAGVRYKQQQWDASITKQTGEAMSVMIDKAKNSAEAQVQVIEVKGKDRVRTVVVTKEVERYVEAPAKKCELSPEFVRAFDTVSGLLDADPNSMPAFDSATGDADEPSGAAVTDAEVLRAHEELVVQYRDLWTDYRALRDWVRSDYAITYQGDH